MSVVSDYSDGVPHVSFLLATAQGETIAGADADTVVYAASTAKLAVLIAAVRAVDDGALDLRQPVTIRRTFDSVIPGAGTFGMDGDEIDEHLPPEGQSAPLADILSRMIVVSSNEATNLVLDLVGFDAVDAAFALCGASASRMQRPYGDLVALAAGLTQEVTAADLVRVMSAIICGRAASETGTAFMVGLLEAQEFATIGPASGARRWGSKSGWVTGIQHDVAFLTSTDDPADGSILAVCTRGYESDDAETVIAAIARLAWQLAGAR